MRLKLSNSLQELPRLGDALRQFCAEHAVPHETLYSVNLAVDELFTNAVTHGYEDDGLQHEITLRIEIFMGSISICMTDDGKPFNPWTDAPVPQTDTPIETRQVGGLGLHLVKSMMDNLEYERRDGRNTIRMRKNYSTTPSAPSAA